MDFFTWLMPYVEGFDYRFVTATTALFFFFFTRYWVWRLPLGKFWYVVVELPGTILHECMGHFLIAILMNGKPIRCSVLPSEGEDGSKRLGYVITTHNTWYNTVPIAMAPLVIFIPVILVPPSSFFSAFFWGLVASSGIPSSGDFKMAFSNLFSVLFYGFLGYAAFFSGNFTIN